LELIRKYFPDLTDQQQAQLTALADLYGDWNTKINVISRKDMDHFYERHVLHSLSLICLFNFGSSGAVIDIGTGGGFPGIPLAVLLPQITFHLIDATGKKIRVVEAVARSLHLDNVTAQHIRAEELKGRRFDLAISRAVAPLKILAGWSRPLVKGGANPAIPGGLICLKGGDLAPEISESSYQPSIHALSDCFSEPWFREKYALHLPVL
jgi:16S rRNA (guanine527-N7)-methyltransferase